MFAIIIIASLFSLLGCEKNPPTSGNHNTGMPINTLQADYYGTSFNNIDLKDVATLWEMRIFTTDTAPGENNSIQKYLVINLLADPHLSMSNNLPPGIYTVTTSAQIKDMIPGAIISSGYATMTDHKEIYFTTGTVKITHPSPNTHRIQAHLTAQDGSIFSFTHHVHDLVITDRTFLSTLTSSQTPTIDSVLLRYHGTHDSPNTATWTAYIMTDGMTQGPQGGIIPGQSTGSTLNLHFYTPAQCGPNPEGRYPFNTSKTAYTAAQGTVSEGQLDGSWIMNFHQGEPTTMAPLRGGYIDIKAHDNGTYTIQIESADDNPYEGQQKTIKTKYTGPVTITNTLQQSDYADGMFFLRGPGFEGSGENDVWTLQFTDPELYDTQYQNGHLLLLDIITRGKNETPYQFNITGNYTLLADNNTPMSIPRAKIVKYTNGIKSETQITSGQLSISYDEATYKYNIDMINLKDTQGHTSTSNYKGIPLVKKGYPKDVVFNPDGSRLTAEFYGTVNQFNNWFIYLEDAAQVDYSNNLTDQPNRVAISLDLLTDINKNYDTLIPDGVYKFNGKELSIGITTLQNYTTETGNQDGNGYALQYIDGHAEFTRVHDNTYNVKIKLTNEYGKTTTANFTKEFKFTNLSPQ